MLYLLLLVYLVLLPNTGATDSPYRIFKDINKNIVVSLNPSINLLDPDVYWKVTCRSSKYNRSWSPCGKIETNPPDYKFETYEKIYFCFNIIINRQKILNETKCFDKYDIDTDLPPLVDILFSNSSTSDGDPYKASLLLKMEEQYMLAVKLYQSRYRVRYGFEDGTRSSWKQEISNNSKEITLKDLTPFTNYTFIADYITKWNKKTWSKPLTKYFKTATAMPYPVQTPDFRYYEWICPTATSQRCMTVYWQSLPMEFRNDELTGYCVQYINGSSSAFSTEQCLDSNNLVVDTLYKDFQDLPRNQTLTFSIVAVTKSRRMSQPTFIEVKNTAPRKPTVVYATKISDTMYNVSWLIEQPQETVNITVFWCQNEITSSKIECIDESEWITVTNTSYLLVNYSKEQLPVFAVHVDTEEGRSSLTKVVCIFIPGKSKKPQKPNIAWAETKFSVMWPTQHCSDLNAIPVAYLLHYAEGKSCENGKKKEFPMIGIKAVENNVDINGLEPDTEYSVCIQVKTRDGISLMSDVITDTTKITEESSKIVLYVLVSLVVGLFIIFALIKYIRRHRIYYKVIKINTMDTHSVKDSTDCNYDKIQNDENQRMDNKYTFLQTDESGYDSFNNSSETEKSHLSSQVLPKSTKHFEEYSQVSSLTGEFVDKSENTENIIKENPSLSNIIEKNENVSNETGYINMPEDYRRLCRPLISNISCMNGDLEKNASHRMDYVDGPSDSSSELSSMSVPTNVNGNLKENVSSRMDYVDEPRGFNSNPLCKNTNSKGSIPDYIFSEPDYISQFPEESTNSSESKPLNRPILQIESKENNQKENSKCNGRTDEEHVKVTLNDGYIPYEHIVEIKGSSLDEINDKNIQKDKQGISQNPNSCDLVNINVHNSSDSLQTQDKEMNKLQPKDNKVETSKSDYVKTESFLGYVAHDMFLCS